MKIKSRNQIEKEDYLEYIKSLPRCELLTAEEEKELGWRIVNENCNDAKEKLAKANLRLVANIARKYETRGLSLVDLIGVGNVGLMRAVHKFDPARGNRFSTYAVSAIKNHIKKALAVAQFERNEIISVPREIFYSINKIAPYLARCQQQGEEPDIKFLANKYGKDPRAIKAVIMFYQAGRGKYSTIYSTKSSEGDLINPNLDSLMARQNRANESIYRVLGDFREVLDRALSDERITQRQREVFLMHAGLNGIEPMSYGEISKKYGVTRQAIMEQGYKAVKKLSENRELAELYDLVWRAV